MNKKVIAIAIVLVVLVCAMAGIYLATRPDTQQGLKSFTVTVVHSDGSEKEFAYQTDAEYLGPFLAQEGLIVMDEVQTTMFHTVDGVRPVWETDHAYWAFYVGQEYASLGISETPIEDGSHFRLVYTLG